MGWQCHLLLVTAAENVHNPLIRQYSTFVDGSRTPTETAEQLPSTARGGVIFFVNSRLVPTRSDGEQGVEMQPQNPPNTADSGLGMECNRNEQQSCNWQVNDIFFPNIKINNSQYLVFNRLRAG